MVDRIKVGYDVHLLVCDACLVFLVIHLGGYVCRVSGPGEGGGWRPGWDIALQRATICVHRGGVDYASHSLLESCINRGYNHAVTLQTFTNLRASGKARVIPKNSEKCSFIMNCMKQNASDCRPPPKFVLPQLQALHDCLLLRKRKRVYMIKFDVSNCYWSILMPKRWRDIFQVLVSGQSYAWSSLPFGWKYSPVICQRLMGALEENSVFDMQVLPFTYLLDILAAGARKDLKRAVRRLRGRLQRAPFVVSPKSSLKQTRVLDCVGKIFDTKRRRMENRKGMVTALLRSWLRLRLRLMRRKGFERFLGRLEWALRPQGGTAPLLARAYGWMLSGEQRVPLSPVRPLLTAVVFAVLPQCYAGQPYVWRGPPCSVQDFIIFADAAPTPNSGFRYGFFVPGSVIRCYKCPDWVDSLQQAELLALVQAFKIAGYKGWRRVAVGSDSLVARSQFLGLRCGTSLPVQNRILRQLFWWRRWSRVQLAVFYVPSDKNPADPPSRRPRFVDREACRTAAEDRYVVWKELQRTFPYFGSVAPFPWPAGQ